MDPKGGLILDSLEEEPIGDTENFIWFVTDIGIVALSKKNENFEYYKLNVENEANKIALDVSKEEREYLEINGKQIFLFYS